MAVYDALDAGGGNIVVHHDCQVAIRLRVPARALVSLAHVSDYREQRIETDLEHRRRVAVQVVALK